jgi:hypothetical protein
MHGHMEMQKKHKKLSKFVYVIIYPYLTLAMKNS